MNAATLLTAQAAPQPIAPSQSTKSGSADAQSSFLSVLASQTEGPSRSTTEEGPFANTEVDLVTTGALPADLIAELPQEPSAPDEKVPSAEEQVAALSLSLQMLNMTPLHTTPSDSKDSQSGAAILEMHPAAAEASKPGIEPSAQIIPAPSLDDAKKELSSLVTKHEISTKNDEPRKQIMPQREMSEQEDLGTRISNVTRTNTSKSLSSIFEELAALNTKEAATPEDGLLKELASLKDKKTGDTDARDTSILDMAPMDAGASRTMSSMPTSETEAAGPRSSRSTFNDNVMAQVEERLVEHLQNGESKITLRLHPEDLGKLHIEIATKEGSVKIQIVAEHTGVKNALAENADSLRQVLEKQNLKMESFSVASGQGSEQQRQQRQNQNQGKDIETIINGMTAMTGIAETGARDTNPLPGGDGLLDVIA